MTGETLICPLYRTTALYRNVATLAQHMQSHNAGAQQPDALAAMYTDLEHVYCYSAIWMGQDGVDVFDLVRTRHHDIALKPCILQYVIQVRFMPDHQDG